MVTANNEVLLTAIKEYTSFWTWDKIVSFSYPEYEKMISSYHFTSQDEDDRKIEEFSYLWVSKNITTPVHVLYLVSVIPKILDMSCSTISSNKDLSSIDILRLCIVTLVADYYKEVCRKQRGLKV